MNGDDGKRAVTANEPQIIRTETNYEVTVRKVAKPRRFK